MATCTRCGARCTGDMCAGCEQIELNEKMYGTTVGEHADDVAEDVEEVAENMVSVDPDHFLSFEDVRDDDAETDGGWCVEQQGLDGNTAQRQTTIDGGVVKDSGGDDS